MLFGLVLPNELWLNDSFGCCASGWINTRMSTSLTQMTRKTWFSLMSESYKLFKIQGGFFFVSRILSLLCFHSPTKITYHNLKSRLFVWKAKRPRVSVSAWNVDLLRFTAGTRQTRDQRGHNGESQRQPLLNHPRRSFKSHVYASPFAFARVASGLTQPLEWYHPVVKRFSFTRVQWLRRRKAF